MFSGRPVVSCGGADTDLLLLLPLLVGFLFGTALQKLFGKLFGFHGVPKVRPDEIQHCIGRLHLLQVRHDGGDCAKTQQRAD